MVRSVVQSEACLYGAFDSTTELPRRQIMNPPNEDIESPLCTRSCSRPVSACWRGLLDEVVESCGKLRFSQYGTKLDSIIVRWIARSRKKRGAVRLYCKRN